MPTGVGGRLDGTSLFAGGAARRTAGRRCPARQVEDHHLPGSFAPRRSPSTLSVRRPHQRRKVPRLCRAGARRDAQTGRCRRSRQSGGSQEQGGTPSHPQGWCSPDLPAQILSRSQSDRASLRQAQDAVAKNGCPRRRGSLHCHRRTARKLHITRMRQLPRKRRVCVKPRTGRSSEERIDRAAGGAAP